MKTESTDCDFVVHNSMIGVLILSLQVRRATLDLFTIFMVVIMLYTDLS